MGYRSEIRAMTNLEGFETMQEIAFKIKLPEIKVVFTSFFCLLKNAF